MKAKRWIMNKVSLIPIGIEGILLYKNMFYKIGGSMKKITLLVTLVFLFTIVITGIKCQEVLQKISGIDKAEPSAKVVKEQMTEIKKENAGEKNRNVRIIIMKDNYTSIYHTDIKLKAKALTIFYDKNYINQKRCKTVSISAESKYFDNNNVLKVSAQGKMKWEGHNIEHDSPEYSGMLYIYKTGSGLVVVNQVDLESYIAGVISSEIGEQAPMEALKAQAVCARNFIIKSKAEEYNKYDAIADDSTNFQVYNRIRPGKRCEQAAKETKNIIMKYKGKVIRAYYFSTSCGYTTDYKIWGKQKQRYLKGSNLTRRNIINYQDTNEFKSFITKKPKSYEKNYPYYRWIIYLSSEQIENSIYKTMGVNVGKIHNIEVNSRGTGGIASQITVYGEKRQIVMQNQNEIRKALCSCYGKLHLSDGQVRNEIEMLPSAFIYIEKISDERNGIGYKIFGGGFGHGSGMSQNGAIELAKKGLSYKKILKKFYYGIKFSSI